MESKIILNNGQEIALGVISEETWSTRILCAVPGNDIVGATVLFGTPENSRRMEYIHSIYRDIYYGYTKINTVNMNSQGTAVHVYLYGDETRHEREYLVPQDYVPEIVTKPVIQEEEEAAGDGSADTDSEN